MLQVAGLGLLPSACSCSEAPSPPGDSGVVVLDAGGDAEQGDAGGSGGGSSDGGALDAGDLPDAGAGDAGTGTSDAGAVDSGEDAGAPDAGAPDAGPCGDLSLVESHSVCVPLDACTSDGDCRNDTRCVPQVGCLPWPGQGARDDACATSIRPGVLLPEVRCELSAAPPGDPFPSHVDVMSTPAVANFNTPAVTGRPSIVALFTATVVNSFTEDLGILRVLSGADCALEANLGGVDVDGDGSTDWLVSSSSPALGDLDGDGSAEIVAFGADGSMLAFTRKQGSWGLLWKTPRPGSAPWSACDVGNHRCALGWPAPAIHDLDDDGRPEVLREGVVFGPDGALRSLSPPGYASAAQGLFPVAANVDDDPLIEYTNGQSLWQWANEVWTQEASYAGPPAPGHVGLADFGDYGSVPVGSPELAVVANDTVAIYALTGEIVMPPVAVPGAVGGGAPTIADFDGDGLPELTVSSRGYFGLFDLDCGPAPRAGGLCASSRCDSSPDGVCPVEGYLAWSRVSQDLSSSATGSSAFDFDGDGVAEVISADECFTRVLDGQTGDVLSSQFRSSCTWYETPIVADADGDHRGDLIVPSNQACSATGTGVACSMLGADGVDPLFPGQRCLDAADCFSGVCDQGLCRCETSAGCCGTLDAASCLEQGQKCAAPPAGTPGAGNTCRAAHPHGLSGLRVYSSAKDLWALSRAIWNQPSYTVTNVHDDGTVPSSGTWAPSWSDPATNGVRWNVGGMPNPLATGDVTAGPSTQFTCVDGAAELTAPVCNRGAIDVPAGLSVGFLVSVSEVCRAVTSTVLKPGECALAGCSWGTPPRLPGQEVDVEVIPNLTGAYRECRPGNNHGVVLAVRCPPG